MTVLKPHLYGMSEYKPPLEGRNPDAHLLLDFNERTTPAGPHVFAALRDWLERRRLHIYPSYGDTVKLLACYADVPPHQLMITNGSDQGIDIIVRAAVAAGDEVILPIPSFPMYSQAVRIEDARIIEIPYDIETGFPTARVLEHLSPATRLVFLPNPNNPTGTAIPKSDILEIAHALENRGVVLVDECYFEYTKAGVEEHLSALHNLFITRTFSKTWGLCSLRFGYVLSCEENISQLLKVRGPYDINQAAVVAVRAALEDPSYVEDYVREVLEESKPLLEGCLRRKGIRFWPSAANFLLALVERPNELCLGLYERGILVRPKEDASGRLCLRMTVGTLAQTKRLVEALEEIL